MPSSLSQTNHTIIAINAELARGGPSESKRDPEAKLSGTQIEVTEIREVAAVLGTDKVAPELPEDEKARGERRFETRRRVEASAHSTIVEDGPKELGSLEVDELTLLSVLVYVEAQPPPKRKARVRGTSRLERSVLRG